MFFQPFRQPMSRRMRNNFGMNSVIRMNHNSGFPHHFAVCRSIRPVEFQLLTIVPDIHHIYEQEHYVIENDQLDNLEPMFLDHSHNQNQTSSGDFYISNSQHVGERGRRVRYEIQPMFLRNRQYVIPVVLLDSYAGLPRPDMLVIPYNTERQADRQNEDPFMIINYLRNQNNFLQPTLLDQRRSRMTFHSDYDEQLNHYIETPIMWPRDYENYYRNDDDLTRYRYAQTPPRNAIRPRRNSNYRAAGAGAGAVEIAEIPRPPVQPAEPAAAAAAARVPVSLQAFTIRALISHAIKENMTCPISMNAIEEGSACVTTCQHIFERQAIERWFVDNSRCPVCRQETTICV